jgi:signal transduction histidine kinase/ActR/RegA family two-component response regulator
MASDGAIHPKKLLVRIAGLVCLVLLGTGLAFMSEPWGLFNLGCGLGLASGLLLARNLTAPATFPEGSKEAELADPQVDEQEDENAMAKFEAQKLESLGVLAGGIAHDFNNLLTSIVGNASIVKLDIPKNHPLREPISEIATASKRAKELISQLLAYSGRGTVEVTRINLNRLVQEMAHLLQTVVSKKATLQLELTSTLCVIEADASQTRQVVMNLITNASDALGDQGGTILLRSTVVFADREMLSQTAFGAELPIGKYIQLEVTDNGSGMSDETQVRIFEPFFTTKATGRGLGLAALIGIVKRHGGTLSVESTVGEGTSFRIMFPLADYMDGDEDLHTEDTTSGIGFVKGLGVVLLVEDEEMVRKVTARMLTKLGYQVVVAGNGQEACDKLEAMIDEIAVVIMDVDMPVMSGIDAMGKMMEINPETKVILASGYTDASPGSLEHTPLAFLPKPFTIRELTRALDAALSLRAQNTITTSDPEG